MSSELTPLRAEPIAQELFTRLGGEHMHIYLEFLRNLVRGARLNKFFPDPDALDNLYKAMSDLPEADPSLQISLKTGLPSEKEIGKIIADKELAPRILKAASVEDLKKRGDAASLRMLEKHDYFTFLNEGKFPKRTHLEMWLRQVDEHKRIAYFTTIFERFDPTEGVFVRYTIQLAQQHARWSKAQVELQGDDLQYTQGFRNVISRYSSDEAEFAFILLSDLPNITVQEVVRGRMGPLWFDGVMMPPEIEQLMKKHPGNFILNLPSERVNAPSEKSASSVREDKNCDPFARFYRESLSPEVRGLADARAEKLGYKVFKERKFCCTRGIEAPLKELLARHGHKCVIYRV